MTKFALTQIDAAINLFTSLLQHGAQTPRYKRNLQWLLNLRTRALSKISSVSASHRLNPQGEGDVERQTNRDREDDEDVELLGWRTRLIERAGQNQQKTIRTIRLSETPTVPPDANVATSLNSFHPQVQIGTPDMANINLSLPVMNMDLTNDLVRNLSELNNFQLTSFVVTRLLGSCTFARYLWSFPRLAYYELILICPK
jgi:hypothetical protein